jgi:uncharacterized membrane protein YfcA
MDTWMVAAVAGVFLLAGFVKGVVGLGLPTVAIALLVLVMPPGQAAAILVLPSLVTNVWQAVAGGDFLALTRRLWPLLLGICTGTALGVLLLPGGRDMDAILWLGIALTVYATLGFVKVQFSVPKASEGWIGFLAGIATGVITVPTAVFTIPGVPYVNGLHLPRHKLVQALGLSFTVSTLALAGALSHAGEMKAALALPVLMALMASLAGMLLGQVVRQRVSPETFRVVFLLGLLGLGLHLVVRGLF